MDLITIIIISVGLAMDCFAVSISAGTTGLNFRLKNLVLMALSFGVFQSVMTLMGWLAGSGFKSFIESFDYWIAFGLLAIIGAKMLKEGLKKDSGYKNDYTSGKVIILLSFATSIDALAAGVSFSVMKSGLLMPVLMIGAVSFAFTILGGAIGKKAGQMFGKRAEIAGGLILIGIGVKILLEHFNII
jgi:putative Mn2+ efflux pump MntP